MFFLPVRAEAADGARFLPLSRPFNRRSVRKQPGGIPRGVRDRDSACVSGKGFLCRRGDDRTACRIPRHPLAGPFRRRSADSDRRHKTHLCRRMLCSSADAFGAVFTFPRRGPRVRGSRRSGVCIFPETGTGFRRSSGCRAREGGGILINIASGAGIIAGNPEGC